MKIELLFVRPKTWNPVSGLIMLFDSTKFSHCAIAYGDYDTKIVVHSNKWRVNIEAFEIFKKHTRIVETVIIDVRGKDFLRNIMRHMGKQYGYLTIIGIVIQRLLRKLGIKINNPFGDGDTTFVCSEIVIHLLKCSTDYVHTLRPELDGPKKLYDEVKKNA